MTHPMATKLGLALGNIQNYILNIMKDLDDAERNEVIQELPMFCDEMLDHIEDGTFEETLPNG